MREPSSSLVALSVVASTPADVWFVGAGGIILHTADHGASFDRCRIASGENLLSVWAASKDDVWILGDLHVFRIENRTTVATLPLQLETHCGSPRNTIYGTSESDVWLANGSLLHTKDRGVTWRRVPACYRQRGDVCASEISGSTTDLIVECPFSAARSGDAGTTWAPTGSPPHAEEQMHVAASDDDLWVVGQSTAIIGRSVDHGATWSTEQIYGVGVESEPIFGVGALGHGWAWLTRRDGIWLRRGRLPWKKEFPAETIQALGGPNEKDVWAIGDHALILHRE